MRRYTDRQILRLGTICLVVMALVMVAAFNLSKFPGLAGTTYRAEFTDASGLHRGNIVEVGGIRSGRVDDLTLDGDKVVVTFTVDSDIEVGTETTATIGVLNLLGEKYLDLRPAGDQEQDPGQAIGLDRTTAAYDAVAVFGELTTTTERIDTTALEKAVREVGRILDASAPHIGEAFDGIARLSRTIASRDAEVRRLLASSKAVTQVLAARSDDLVTLMDRSNEVFAVLQQRRQDVHRLLVNARRLATELEGVARDNQATIGPALDQVHDLLTLLQKKDAQLKGVLAAVGPYAAILGNIIGTGPWFDAYVVNLAAIPTGEFTPGVR